MPPIRIPDYFACITHPTAADNDRGYTHHQRVDRPDFSMPNAGFTILRCLNGPYRNAPTLMSMRLCFFKDTNPDADATAIQAEINRFLDVYAQQEISSVHWDYPVQCRARGGIRPGQQIEFVFHDADINLTAFTEWVEAIRTVYNHL